MNKEEIKHFKSLLRQGSLRHINILLDDKFQKELLNVIKDYEILQERIDNATERLNTLIEFWIKYNPIDNTMQVEQFKGVINILGGKEC